MRELQEDYFVASSSMLEQMALLDKNFDATQKNDLPECGKLNEQFAGAHVVISGGSVVTLALDLAIRFGAADITLVGADMAYTGGRSHAGGLGRKIAEGMELRKVLSVTGEYIETSRNLDIYRKWIEHRIERCKWLAVYNTASGARIKGTIEKSLCEIAKNW